MNTSCLRFYVVFGWRGFTQVHSLFKVKTKALISLFSQCQNNFVVVLFSKT